MCIPEIITERSNAYFSENTHSLVDVSYKNYNFPFVSFDDVFLICLWLCFMWCDVFFPAFAAATSLVSCYIFYDDWMYIRRKMTDDGICFVLWMKKKRWSRPWKTLKRNALRTISFIFYVSLCGNSKLYSLLAVFCMMNGFVLNVLVNINKVKLEFEDYRELRIEMWSSPKNCSVTALIIIKSTLGFFLRLPFHFSYETVLFVLKSYFLLLVY